MSFYVSLAQISDNLILEYESHARDLWISPCGITPTDRL
ncbi:MAG: hypothetical protein BWX44_01632 [Spirochaetes bacterium ADurb.Bin001]|nr:MAG: hypothetical protein BWX44_01632 [Spirochaetes bacterium ADurb.Bin001]